MPLSTMSCLWAGVMQPSAPQPAQSDIAASSSSDSLEFNFYR